MIKVIIQEERPLEDSNGNLRTADKFFVTTNEFLSEDRIVVAAMLRGVADRFDPPKASMR